MNWAKTLGKAVLGFLTFVVGYIASNPEVVTNLIPENVATMSVGGAVTALIVGIANWLKHKGD